MEGLVHLFSMQAPETGFKSQSGLEFPGACCRFSPGTLVSSFFFFCVPSHSRFSVRLVRRSLQSAAVSQPVPKTSCGHPPDWAMSGISSHRRWGRIAGCGWGFEDPCRMDIHLSGKFSVCGGGRGVDSVQFSAKRL